MISILAKEGVEEMLDNWVLEQCGEATRFGGMGGGIRGGEPAISTELVSFNGENVCISCD